MFDYLFCRKPFVKDTQLGLQNKVIYQLLNFSIHKQLIVILVYISCMHAEELISLYDPKSMRMKINELLPPN